MARTPVRDRPTRPRPSSPTAKAQLRAELHYCGDGIHALGDAITSLVSVLNRMLQEKPNRHG
jgi:hypothetical protein